MRRLLQFNPNKRITADEALTHPYVLNFHNSKEEISKGYDVVPQLNDNVRLTIDEYRNKLYKFIQDSKNEGGQTQNHRPSTKHKPNKPAQQQQQQQLKSVPVKSAPVATHAKYSTDKNSNDSGDEANYKNYHNSSSNYNSSKHAHQQNDNSSDHSDGSSTSGTPPHHNYYNASNASNHQTSMNHSYTSQYQQHHNNNGTTSSLSNYNNKRQKHPSEYNTSTNPNKTMPVEDSADKNYLGGVAGYTGVAFGRTTHPKPPPQAPTNNVYTKNHQRSINASRQRSMENLNASMLNSNYYNSHQGVANRSYLNASPMSNASGRPQTNSAPVPNNASYGYSTTGGNSRPLSSTANNHNHNHIHQTNHFTSNTRQGKNGPVIMRNLDKPSGVGSQGHHGSNNTVHYPHSSSPSLYRPISATDLRASSKPVVFGRKQFHNQTNMTNNLAAKNLFGNYSQQHSTITANGLNALKKWW